MTSRTKKVSQIKYGTILSYLQMGLGIIINLCYTPVMIRTLGKSEYGLYNTVASTISMLSILSLGFNSSYIRFFSKYNKQKDKNAIFRLNGLYLLIFIIIGIVAFICGMFISEHLYLIFDTGLTEEEYRIARTLMILLTINLSISFPMSVFANIVSANERFIFLKLLGIIRSVLSPLITMPLLLLGFRSIAMVSVTLSVHVFVDILYMYYVFFVLHNKFYFSSFEKGLFKGLLVYTVFIALNMIIDQINWNIDKLLLGRFRGTAEVAIYSVGYSLHQYYHMFSTAISGVFTPRVHSIVNKYDDYNQRNIVLTELFVKVGRVQYLLLGLIASGIVFFGKPFIKFWAGPGYENAYWVALLLIIPASIALTQNIGIEIQRAQNNHQFRSVAYSIMALFNLIASIYLCQKYGAIGSAIGTAAALILANGFIMNIYYYKKCGINIPLFWNNIFSIIKGQLVPIGIGFLIMSLVDIKSIVQLLLYIVLYSILYAISVWFISMNDFEKQLILKPLFSIAKKV